MLDLIIPAIVLALCVLRIWHNNRKIDAWWEQQGARRHDVHHRR